MKANNIVKTIMSNKRITQNDMTTLLNMKSQSAVSGALGRDMRISTLVEFIKVLDCEIIVRDKTSGEEYLITE